MSPGTRIAFCILVTIIAFVPAYGQQNGSIIIPDSAVAQILTLHDGSQLVGRVISIADSAIVFQSDLGNVEIPVSKIKMIREVPRSSLRGGHYWFPNPNATRLFFAPTGRMLKKGEGYFSDYYIFFPGFSYGLTDNISFGGGLSIFPGLSLGEQAYFITPKIGIAASEKTSFALGGLIISVPSDFANNIKAFGVLYGVGTYGNLDGSISGGIGYGFYGNRLASKPVVMIGGEKRLSRRVSFVSENWIFPGVDNPVISYGVRLFGENLSVDLGFFNVTGKDAIFPGVPWVDFVFNFR